MEFTVDLSRLQPAMAQKIINGLQHEDRAQHALGLLEQRRLKQFHDDMSRAGLLNTELGRQNMTRSANQDLMFKRAYGQLCWADPDFAPWVLKQDQHADMRVKDVGTRIQSGYTGKGDTRG